MINHAVLDLLFAIAVAVYVVVVAAFVFLYRNVRRGVEEALKNAGSAEQARIRKQLVKAMFPPRFPRH